MEYACFFILLLTVLAVAGVVLVEHKEQRGRRKKPIPMPILSDWEKRKKLNEWIGPFGFAYEERQDIFYARMDAWQRSYGYGKLYDDMAAAWNIMIDCEPIYFQYGEKKWLIEFWKGQYGIATGGEVGVYYLPREEAEKAASATGTIYQSVEEDDMLPMQMVLWKQGCQLFWRKGYHWWLTGFVLGEFSKPKDLIMDIEMEFPDFSMRDAFCQGLKEAGYLDSQVAIRERKVWIRFDRPHTSQPMTQKGLFRWGRQHENRRNCRLYRKITEGYTSVYDKLYVLRLLMPQVFRRLERWKYDQV